MNRGPWERLKPPEYHSACDYDKVQWACGIPPRHWNVQLDSLSFAAATYENGGEMARIAPTTQKEYFIARVAEAKTLLKKNRFVCITSSPTDEQGLAAACLLAASYIEKEWEAEAPVRVRVDDIQDYEQALKLGKAFYTSRPEVLFIHNINENSSKERLSLVRDLMLNFEGCYRGVVAAHKSPLVFARDFLKMEPAEVYHFTGKRMVR